MKTLLLMLFVLGFSSTGFSDTGYTIVKDEKETEYFIFSVEYPVLDKGVVPAYESINAATKSAVAGDCTEDEEEAKKLGLAFDHSAVASIIEINQNYVTYEISGSSYCGGAHPNNFIFFMNFNSKTGDLVDYSKEVPAQDYMSDDFAVHKTKLAESLLKNHRKEVLSEMESCGEPYTTDEEAVSFISSLNPAISGLTKNKVIVQMYPPHAIMACAFTFRVPYSEVESMFAEDSIVKKWISK